MHPCLPLLTISMLAAGESAAPVPWPAVDGLGRQLAMPGDDGLAPNPWPDPGARPSRLVTALAAPARARAAGTISG
jgi:hypothetical protein